MREPRTDRGRRRTPKPEPTTEELFRRAVDRSLQAMDALVVASAACRGDTPRCVKAGMLHGLLNKYLAALMHEDEAAKRQAEVPEGATAASYLADGGRA